jgi:rubrerythrin
MAYKTENNVLAAFGGESQACRRYLLFAEKADAEGHPQVARLFRAVAAAEAVHARNHMTAIDAVGTTKDNLLAASLGERQEQAHIYPDYIEIAKEERNDRAERTFTLANKVEGVHCTLFEKAYEEIKAGRPLAETDYCVCQVCGNTVAGSAPEKCLVCGAPASRVTSVE